jgi:hypothetical protein
MKAVILVVLACVGLAFGQCEIETAPLVKSDVVPVKTGNEPTQLAYGVDDDGTKLIKVVPASYASGSGFWFRFPDGHEVLFQVP